MDPRHGCNHLYENDHVYNHEYSITPRSLDFIRGDLGPSSLSRTKYKSSHVNRRVEVEHGRNHLIAGQ